MRSAERPDGLDGLAAGRPGLLLEDEIALDRERADRAVEVEQVEQVRIDEQLDATLARLPGMPKHRRSELSSSRKAVSKRLTTSLLVQRGQRSRVRDIRS